MQHSRDNDRAIMRWLLVCLLLIFAMVILGGVTRLTGSGLSMVTWHPTGALPPLTSAEWQAEFELYQQYPEFQKLNRHLTLDGFKRIFWFEYSHRMLGRLIGLVFPAAVFVLLAAQDDPARAHAAPGRDVHPRRAAGIAWLVHGEKRPGQQPPRQPVPPHARTCSPRF